MSKKNLIFVILMIVSWAFYFVLCKICITATDSPFVAGLLLRIMTLAFLSTYWVITKKENAISIPVKPFFLTIAIGIIAFMFDALINIGFQYIPVSIGTVLLKTEILFVLLFSLLFFKVRIKKRKYLFIALMLLGVILCTNLQLSDMTFNLYSLLFIASAALNAICAFAIKYIQKKYSIGSFAIAYTNNIVSLVLYGICTASFNRQQFIGLFSDEDDLWGVVIIFVLCSVCQTGLMITYYRNLKELPVWFVKAFLLFVPALSMIIEFTILRTTISLISLLGFVLVSIGGLGITIDSKHTRLRGD